jgi:acetylglutamate kinase
MVPEGSLINSRLRTFKMARKNTTPTYACGNCGTHGHNKRTCPELGLVAKVKPVKKPRAKKVVEETPAIAPLATEEQLEALRALAEEIAAEVEAACEEESEREPTDEELTEIEAGEVDAAFEAEIPAGEVVEVSDEEEAAFMNEFAALFA